jgi:hypothetical protein
MSALGQKPTCALHQPMSALPPIATAKADFLQTVIPALPPEADIDRKLLNVGSSIGRTDASVFVEPADMVLGVKLKTKLSDEVELGLQKVNMTFLIVHQLFEQVARHIIPG